MYNQRICIICHLYYQDMWDEIREYLANLEAVTNFDLYITITQENPELIKKIQSSFNENINVNIELVENTLGADIYPFMKTLDSIDLDNYDIIYKIHTKQTFIDIKQKLPPEVNINFYVGDKLWRNFLLNSILGKRNVKRVLKAFKKDKKAGIISFYPLLAKKELTPDKIPINTPISWKKKDFGNFYCGTIFEVRANLLKCMQNKFTKEEFMQPYDKFSLMTYVLEGFLSYAVELQGYKFINLDFISNKKILTLLSHNNKVALTLYKFYINKFIFRKNIV